MLPDFILAETSWWRLMQDGRILRTLQLSWILSTRVKSLKSYDVKNPRRTTRLYCRNKPFSSSGKKLFLSQATALILILILILFLISITSHSSFSTYITILRKVWNSFAPHQPRAASTHLLPNAPLTHSLAHSPPSLITSGGRKSRGAHSAASRSLDTGSGEWSIASANRYEPRPSPALVSHRLWPRG